MWFGWPLTMILGTDIVHLYIELMRENHRDRGHAVLFS